MGSPGSTGGVPLGDILTQRREAVAPERFGNATPVTVHLDGRISIRNRTAPYKGAMWAALPGDVVFSKIDARHGAIGLIPPTIARAVVTTEFPVFQANPERLDARFLDRLLRSGGFIEALKSKATGTSGRKRITPEHFKELEIPLPSLAEQRGLVEAAEAAEAEAAALEMQAASVETAAARAFEADLGLAPPPPLPDRPLFIARFADLYRWSHDAALRAQTASPAASAWPITRLGEIVDDLENGWSPQCLNRPAGKDEWGVLKVGAVSTGTYDARQNKALPKTLAPRPALEVQTGQILISRANITRLVGAAAYVYETPSRLMLCDKIFRVVPSSPSIVSGTFLAEVMRTPPLRLQIESKLTGTSPTMKNISKPALLSLTFPLPPIDEQERLVKALAAARTDVAKLRAQAGEKRAQVRADFEAAVGV